MPDTSSAEFFEQKYASAQNADPWNFASAPYELQRYDAVMNALRDRRYEAAFEPGCSVGVLTAQLATLCDNVYATDFSPTAVAAAKARCAHLPNVTVACEALSASARWQTFDLIALCEIGYYFHTTAWTHLLNTMVTAMRPGTVLLASHWLGTSADHVQTGAAVHAAITHPLLQHTLHEPHEGFLLDRWTRLA